MKKFVMSALMLAVSAAFVAAENAQAASLDNLNNLVKEAVAERSDAAQEMCNRGKRHVKRDRHVRHDRHRRHHRHNRHNRHRSGFYFSWH